MLWGLLRRISSVAAAVLGIAPGCRTYEIKRQCRVFETSWQRRTFVKDVQPRTFYLKCRSTTC